LIDPLIVKLTNLSNLKRLPDPRFEDQAAALFLSTPLQSVTALVVEYFSGKLSATNLHHRA
jgi:hypothetical protein